ncbi:AIF_collapsed_G0053090.mRNA.1.CDS.1 [Saccharomyces cerevisiae]|nr:AIF_collapsed_G0053090.mRNA.1.CDS.1 [Saccharomyces cerevisiae]
MSDKSKQIGSSTSIPTLKARQVKTVSHPLLIPVTLPDNVLEMLLSLPPGSESKEIIADTIYSYSSTMDGRRFATDFIKNV